MLVVGLTGGIGSGKSTACRFFQDLGVPVIDADQIAREVVEPGTEGLAALVEHFGSDILDEAGRLHRRRLREQVFRNPGQREELESLLHPRIRQSMLEQLAALNSPYAILAIPLLVEAGWQDLVQRVLVIDAPGEAQLARLQQRDDMQREAALRMLAAQCGRKQRLAAADDIIDNSGDEQTLREAVQGLHHEYLRLASQGVGVVPSLRSPVDGGE